MADAPRKSRPEVRVLGLELDASGPVSLTLACRVESLIRPSDLADRSPKAVIHHNVPGGQRARFGELTVPWSAVAPSSSR